MSGWGRRWALIAGGGTGGHVVPAIAIGRALVAGGHPPESLLFVGSRRGIEAKMVPAAGFDVALLPGRGIARRLTPDNIGAVAGLLAAGARALVMVRRTRPSVVISVGGYASVACAAASVVWRVPLVVAEQNFAPGLANRLLARFARASAVSFAGTPLPRAVVTGNPVRPEIGTLDRSVEGRRRARQGLGLPEDATVISVAGGSLGARRINDAVLGLAAAWSSRRGIAIYHVVGERDYESFASRAPQPVAGGLVYQQVRFEERMDLVLCAADVAVQRAGATTVAELAVAGVASVLVPLPGAPGDHQTANALRMAGAGAAVVIADSECDAARLGATLDSLLADRAHVESMGEAARRLAHPDAAVAVARLAEEHARA